MPIDSIFKIIIILKETMIQHNMGNLENDGIADDHCRSSGVWVKQFNYVLFVDIWHDGEINYNHRPLS